MCREGCFDCARAANGIDPSLPQTLQSLVSKHCRSSLALMAAVQAVQSEAVLRWHIPVCVDYTDHIGQVLSV
jgi:hypothetical protein